MGYFRRSGEGALFICSISLPHGVKRARAVLPYRTGIDYMGVSWVEGGEVVRIALNEKSARTQAVALLDYRVFAPAW